MYTQSIQSASADQYYSFSMGQARSPIPFAPIPKSDYFANNFSYIFNGAETFFENYLARSLEGILEGEQPLSHKKEVISSFFQAASKKLPPDSIINAMALLHDHLVESQARIINTNSIRLIPALNKYIFDDRSLTDNRLDLFFKSKLFTTQIYGEIKTNSNISKEAPQTLSTINAFLMSSLIASRTKFKAALQNVESKYEFKKNKNFNYKPKQIQSLDDLVDIYFFNVFFDYLKGLYTSGSLGIAEGLNVPPTEKLHLNSVSNGQSKYTALTEMDDKFTFFHRSVLGLFERNKPIMVAVLKELLKIRMNDYLKCDDYDREKSKWKKVIELSNKITIPMEIVAEILSNEITIGTLFNGEFTSSKDTFGKHCVFCNIDLLEDVIDTPVIHYVDHMISALNKILNESNVNNPQSKHNLFKFMARLTIEKTFEKLNGTSMFENNGISITNLPILQRLELYKDKLQVDNSLIKVQPVIYDEVYDYLNSAYFRREVLKENFFEPLKMIKMSSLNKIKQILEDPTTNFGKFANNISIAAPIFKQNNLEVRYIKELAQVVLIDHSVTEPEKVIRDGWTAVNVMMDNGLKEVLVTSMTTSSGIVCVPDDLVIYLKNRKQAKAEYKEVPAIGQPTTYSIFSSNGRTIKMSRKFMMTFEMKRAILLLMYLKPFSLKIFNEFIQFISKMKIDQQQKLNIDGTANASIPEYVPIIKLNTLRELILLQSERDLDNSKLKPYYDYLSELDLNWLLKMIFPQFSYRNTNELVNTLEGSNLKISEELLHDLESIQAQIERFFDQNSESRNGIDEIASLSSTDDMLRVEVECGDSTVMIPHHKLPTLKQELTHIIRDMKLKVGVSLLQLFNVNPNQLSEIYYSINKATYKDKEGTYIPFTKVVNFIENDEDIVLGSIHYEGANKLLDDLLFSSKSFNPIIQMNNLIRLIFVVYEQFSGAKIFTEYPVDIKDALNIISNRLMTL